MWWSFVKYTGRKHWAFSKAGCAIRKIKQWPLITNWKNRTLWGYCFPVLGTLLNSLNFEDSTFYWVLGQCIKYGMKWLVPLFIIVISLITAAVSILSHVECQGLHFLWIWIYLFFLPKILINGKYEVIFFFLSKIVGGKSSQMKKVKSKVHHYNCDLQKVVYNLQVSYSRYVREKVRSSNAAGISGISEIMMWWKLHLRKFKSCWIAYWRHL